MPDAGLRTVPMAPPSQTTTTTEGQLRANWNGLAWVMLPYVPPTSEPEQQPVAMPRIVSVLGFRRRFTPAEKAAIELAAVDRPDQPEAKRMQAAALRAALADQAAAQFIRLDDPDTVQGVRGLKEMGVLTIERVNAILLSPVQMEELP